MSLCHIQASQWRAAPNKKGAPFSRAPARRRSGRQHNPHRASRSLRRPPYYHYPPSHAVARRPLPASMPLHPGCLSVRPACVTILSLYRVPCARVRPFPPCGSSARLHPCAIFHLDIFHAHAYGLPPPWAQTARGQSYENLPLSGNRTDIPSIPVHESHRAKARCAALSIFPFISLSLAAAFHNCHQKARRRRHRCRSPVAAQIFNGRGFTHGSAVAAATAVTGVAAAPVAVAATIAATGAAAVALVAASADRGLGSGSLDDAAETLPPAPCHWRRGQQSAGSATQASVGRPRHKHEPGETIHSHTPIHTHITFCYLSGCEARREQGHFAPTRTLVHT